MADRTGIEWTDATWNPVRGCSRVSPGCENCYAERIAARFDGPGMAYEGLINRHGVWNGTTKLIEQALYQPLRWARPRRIFVNSMSDLFHESIPEHVIDAVFGVMAMCPQHTFQILTKRAARMVDYFRVGKARQICWGFQATGVLHRLQGGTADEACASAMDRGQHAFPLPNVWLGVSVEDQERAAERIPLLLQTSAAVRFLSCEPLLGAIDLRRLQKPLDLPVGPCGRPFARIDWVIAGGESGPGARPMHPRWARSLRNQCVAAGVAFFFKQWGEWAPATIENDAHTPVTFAHIDDAGDRAQVMRFGKGKAGRLLDGRTWDEFPTTEELESTNGVE